MSFGKALIVFFVVSTGLFVSVMTLDSAISFLGVKKGIILWVTLVLISLGIVRYFIKKENKK